MGEQTSDPLAPTTEARGGLHAPRGCLSHGLEKWGLFASRTKSPGLRPDDRHSLQDYLAQQLLLGPLSIPLL
jgi:hypothetical protein